MPPVSDSLPLASEPGVCPSFVSQWELYLMIVAVLAWTFRYLLNFHITLNYESRDFSVLRCIRHFPKGALWEPLRTIYLE